MPPFFIFLLALLFSQSLPTNALAEGRINPPSRPASQLLLTDDQGYRGLATALEKSCSYYENKADHIFELCGQHLSGQELRLSYAQIITRLQGQADQNIDRFLSENFTLCEPTALLVTGYYTPVLPGSLTPSSTYRFPLYSLPGQENLRRLSRAEIDNSMLLKGHETAYLSDPLDLFFLHVQGSGIIELPDGSRRLASFAGDNGRPYTSIGKILIQEGKLRREDVTMASISTYLTSHPEQRKRILNHNERYIFFHLTDPGPHETLPSGSLGYTLTPARSVAMDSNHYPPAILGLLTGRRPLFDKENKVSWQPFSRLVTHQDSGAAIKGPHRLDLYLGSGQQAGKGAGIMKEKGSFAILIPNLSFRHVHGKIADTHNCTVNFKPRPEFDTASGE